VQQYPSTYPEHLSFPQTPNRTELQDCVLSYTEDLDFLNRAFKLEGERREEERREAVGVGSGEGDRRKMSGAEVGGG
jgi:hypothetical protein